MQHYEKSENLEVWKNVTIYLPKQSKNSSSEPDLESTSSRSMRQLETFENVSKLSKKQFWGISCENLLINSEKNQEKQV
jgi:hypothetical protein